MAGEEQIARQLGQYSNEDGYETDGLTQTEEQVATTGAPSTQAIKEALREGRRLADLTAEGVLSEEDLAALDIDVSDQPVFERPQDDITRGYEETDSGSRPTYDPTEHSVDPSDF